MNDSRITIGLYLRNLDEEYQLSVYRAVRTEAQKRGINLVCIQREALRPASADKSRAGSSRDFLNLQGVLFLSSVLLMEKQEEIIPYLTQRFGDIPCVSIGIRLLDFVSIIIRTRESMELLMEHLIVDHGYRKFLFIGGPTSHRDNTVREHVFRRSTNTLLPGNFGIEGTVVNGEFNDYTGNDIVREYIENHPEEPLDAIVAANDNMAIGALKALQTSPNRNWHRCAVTGFDDIPQASLEKPSLTTVHQPLDTLGTLAVQALADLIAGKPVERVIPINSNVVVRESCGCTQIEAPHIHIPGHNEIATVLEQIQYQNAVSERHLRDIGLFGQELSALETTEEMSAHIGRYLSNLGVHSFRLISFPEQGIHTPAQGLLLYERVRGSERIVPGHGEEINLKEFFSALFPDGPKSETQCLYHLTSGELQLGLVVYDTEDFAHPYICSMAIFISNTLRRLAFLEREKERARILEHEVALRTADLVLTNRRLAEEARRRLAVEAEVLKISEMERLRFSLDLHDDICQRLAGISMYCKALPSVPADVTEMVDETLARTRRYAHDSFPVELNDVGLHQALRGLCAQIEASGTCVCEYRWDAGESSPLDRNRDINVYRIVQEALQNMVKHSRAEHAEVAVSLAEDRLLVVVRDDGKGTPSISTSEPMPLLPAAGERPGGAPVTGRQLRRMNGLGLTSMKYRAHQLRANFSILSDERQGTEIRLSIPLHAENGEQRLEAELNPNAPRNAPQAGA